MEFSIFPADQRERGVDFPLLRVTSVRLEDNVEASDNNGSCPGVASARN
jgi:hypothetical protein